MKLKPVTYKILYNSKDITRDISAHLLSLSYSDKVEGESDELEIELEDKELLWQNDWYPKKGDTVEAEIIFNDFVLPCGKFTIDEIKLRGSISDGDKITISCLAAYITKKMRTKRSSAHENKTLRQLAQSFATTNQLTVQGTIPDIRIGRITQNRESDLSFLNRMAGLYGLVFSVRANLLIFQKRDELEGSGTVFSVDKTECSSYEFTDKTEQTFKKSQVQYHNSQSNKTIEYEAVADDEGVSDDTLTFKEKAENQQQAELIGKSKLNKANSKQKTVTVDMPGIPIIVSGNNIEMTGFGKLSGKYHILESTHALARDGYNTSFEAKKVGDIGQAKYKPKKKPKTNYVRWGYGWAQAVGL